jgi:hypothetical protein
MAFPTATVSQGIAQTGSASGDRNVTVPTCAAGDLLIAVVSADGTPNFSGTLTTNMTSLVAKTNSGTALTSQCFYRICDGSETSPWVLNLSASETATVAFILIPASTWHGTTPPEGVAYVVATTATPNPPTVTASWGSDDNLFIAVDTYDLGTISVTNYPTNYSDDQTNYRGNNTAGVGIGIATRSLAAASDDPGTFTNSASDQTLATTIVVRPAASGTLYTPATMNGGLTFSGSLAKQGRKPLTGGLTFSGAFSKRLNKALAGSLSFGGSLVKLTKKDFTGGLTFSGVLGASRVILKALTGGLSFVGSLSKRTNKPLAGGVTPSGVLSKRTNKALAGGLSFVGAFSKRTNKVLAGGLTFAGNLAKRTNKALAGGLTFVGSLTKQTNKALSGALTFSGSVVGEKIVVGTLYFKELAGSLTFSGSLAGLFIARIVDRGEALSELLLRQMFGGKKPWRVTHKPLKRDKHH